MSSSRTSDVSKRGEFLEDAIISNSIGFGQLGPSSDDSWSTQELTAVAPSTSSLASTLAEWGITDAIAAKQWHLGKLGNLGAIWKEYTGKGISFGVYDSGVDTRVKELEANYDASKEVIVDGKKYDGSYRPAAGPHGTSVAGLIAAAKDGQGTVGVAYDAKITGVNIFDPYSGGGRDPGIFINGPDYSKFIAAFEQGNKFDIINNSWGPGTNSHANVVNRTVEGSRADMLVDALTSISETGRGGLGTIAVKAAGNYGANYNNAVNPFGVDGNGDSAGNDRHWVTVAAHREVDGYASSYSARGAHLLISAPSADYAELRGTGVWASDVHGREGYNTYDNPGGEIDYTDNFGGTSAASPIVAGVIGLMLEANGNLGWRDVKNILASSAKMPVAFETGPTSIRYVNPANNSPTLYHLNEDRFKITGDGASSTVNGGGYHFSTDYGYGAIDAYSAVRMAEVWSLFNQAQTSANEYNTSVSKAVNQVIPPAKFGTGGTITYTPVSFTIDVTDDMDIEHLDLYYTYSAPGNNLAYTRPFQIELKSPDGTVYNVNMNAATSNFGPSSNGPGTQVVSFAGLRGETSAGQWTVTFTYPAPVSNPATATFANTLMQNLKLDFFGTQKSANNVHTYTDEFATMLAVEGQEGRSVLTDTNGGVDWINAAAVTSDVNLSLVAGTSTSFGGTSGFTIAADTQIENAVTGDGNDTLTGNALDNELRGMRGNDTLLGGAGNDRLFGGVGDDILFGGDGNDMLDGGKGVDFMNGGAGDDTYVIDDAGDQVVELANSGYDTVVSSVSHTLGFGFEALRLTGTAAIAGIGNDADNVIVGNAGNNRITAGAGNDTVATVSGSGLIITGGGFDVVDGGAGIDTLQVGGVRSDYQMLQQGSRTFLVTARGATEVSNVEQFQFGWGSATTLASAGVSAFDGLSYIAGYADLRAAFGTDAAKGATHFVEWGFAENRSLKFNGLDYIASYGDLIKAFGADATAGARHFIQFGAGENRTTTFDGWAYLASYGDLIQAYGADESAAAKHFIQWGSNENRTISFNAAAYAAANADVAAAYGNDAQALARHYVTWGFAEGRSLGTASSSSQTMVADVSNDNHVDDAGQAMGLAQAEYDNMIGYGTTHQFDAFAFA